MNFGEKFVFSFKRKIIETADWSLCLFKCESDLSKKDGTPLKEILIKGVNLPERHDVILKVDTGSFDLSGLESGRQPILIADSFHLLERKGYFPEPFYCKFDKLIFYNEKNGYTVAKYNIVNTHGIHDPDGYLIDSIVAIGHFIPVENSVNITFQSGEWVKSKQGDWQIEIKNFDMSLPDDEEGILAYLSNLQGCGETTAKKIYNKFKENCYDVLENHIEEIIKLPRVSAKKAYAMRESHMQAKPAKEVIQFLSGYGVTVNKALKIFDFYTAKGDTPEKILNRLQTSPFEIIEIEGFAFRTADNISKAMSLSNLSRARIRSAILYILSEETAEGNLFSKRKTLISKTCKLLNENIYPNKERNVNENDVNRALSEMITLKMVYKEIEEEIYLIDNYNAEVNTAKRISFLLKQPCKTILSPEKVKNEVSLSISKMGFIHAEKQAEAAEKCLSNKISIITGGPGTGKTSIIKIILDVYQKCFPKAEIRLCAPTGRAAQRMTESTGMVASTIHRLLELKGKQTPDKNPIENVDLLIVDECSMIDVYLMSYFLNQAPDFAKIIFVGDAFQLPSIGAGDVFNDFIKSGVIPTTILNKIFRQEGVTKIAVNAAMIKNGVTTPLFEYEENEFEFIEASDSKTCEEIILQKMHEEYLNIGDLDKIQVLVPTRKEKVVVNPNTGKKDYENIKQRCNATTLNRDIQNAINPLPDEISKSNTCDYIHISGSEVAKRGDKVSQLKNDYDLEVFNGDIGYVIDILTDSDNANSLIAKIYFPGEKRTVEYSSDKFKELGLAYATTVHKAQGSEYDSVIIGITSEHYSLLRRNIIYTAITRARKKVIIVGSKKFYATAVKNVETDTRNTHLANRILILTNGIACPDRSQVVLAEKAG